MTSSKKIIIDKKKCACIKKNIKKNYQRPKANIIQQKNKINKHTHKKQEKERNIMKKREKKNIK